MPNFVLVAESVYDQGFAIAVAGLAIVFFALFVLTLFISAMPWLTSILDRYFPAHDHSRSPSVHPESQVPDDGPVLAAIGFVLHHEYEKNIRESKNKTSS
ncbi:OadG family protein [Rubripirellula reticaptiva]|uniref:Oxaloacetate decarboxylase, gamma chain n=1 Tax=Rubripirellula reticaptiva TaxID=2528013 RepID=A0A5C6EJM0_9BACT|nr:OadG family protein [Rubripirellula reticaptiva]TWU47831.1 Oxaloacetate decarboxylase, gamma chain [Rubripirellula reticaptiva]